MCHVLVSSLLCVCVRVCVTQTLDMIMALFNDGTGHLDVPAFTDIIHRRRKLWNTRVGPDGVRGGLLSAFSASRWGSE